MNSFVVLCFLFAATRAQLRITSPAVATQIANSVMDSKVIDVTTTGAGDGSLTYMVLTDTDDFDFRNSTSNMLVNKKEFQTTGDNTVNITVTSTGTTTMTANQTIVVTIKEFAFKKDSYSENFDQKINAGGDVLMVMAEAGAGRTATYSLEEDANSTFAIDGSSGQIKMAPGKTLKIDETTYSLRAKASDGTLMAMVNVTVTTNPDSGAAAVIGSALLVALSVISTRLYSWY